jgi:1,2-phenylacetyl-CoA epoxidase catalytic subunit
MRDLLPEQDLIAAVLRQALRDARSDSVYAAPARQWLRDAAAVQVWLDLAGCPAGTYAALLREAGVEEDNG